MSPACIEGSVGSLCATIVSPSRNTKIIHVFKQSLQASFSRLTPSLTQTQLLKVYKKIEVMSQQVKVTLDYFQ